MRRYQLLMSIVAVLACGAAAWSATLDEARRLYDEGSVDAALAEIDAVLDSDAAASEKATALDLLGTIAADKGYLALARQAWSRLVDEYPDAAESTDAKTKLALVEALLKATGDETGPEEQAVAEVERAAAPEPAEAPPAVTVSPAPEPTARPAPSSGLVLLAAQGKPYDAVIEAGDRIVEFLREQGVNAVSATGGIPVARASKMVLPFLLQAGKEQGAESVLLLTADYATVQKMALDCYDPEGAELWRLKISGGTGWKGRPYSKTGINEKLVERFKDKLQSKVGDPGLSVTLQ